MIFSFGSCSFGNKEATKVKITYSTQVGTAPAAKDVSVGYKLVANDLKALSADGYKFVGWYKENTFKTEACVGEEINADTTLYAKWIPKIDVGYAYKIDNGDWSDPVIYTDVTVFSTNLSQLLTEKALEGYSFKIYSDKECTKEFTGTDYTAVTTSITLYIVFTKL